MPEVDAGLFMIFDKTSEKPVDQNQLVIQSTVPTYKPNWK